MSAMQRFMTFLGFAEEAPEEDGAETSEAEARRRAPVLSLHTARQLEIVVLEPRAFDDARRAADCLRDRRPVVLNLQAVDPELSRRIVDFLSGVTYALDGHLQRVGEAIFLFTPSTVTIHAEVVPTDRAGLLPLG